MWKNRIVAGLLCAGLSACAIDGKITAPKLAASRLENIVADADTAAKVGQTDKALSALREATVSFPSDKIPWLYIAQIQFEQGRYGEAIAGALEALQRDSHDKLANSIVAVSGLRLSTAALADLTQQNNLSGSLKNEAQDLAKLLRASLGEDVLVPPAGANAKAAVRPAVKKAPAPLPAGKTPVAGSPVNSADPFGALK